MGQTLPDSQQPRGLVPDADLQEEKQSITSEPGDSEYLICEECETLFTRPESAQFRERLAKLPAEGIWQRHRANTADAEGPRRSILEDSIMTFEKWAKHQNSLKHRDSPQLQWEPEPDIELRFSRSRISLLQGACGSCTLCQLLISLWRKE